MPNTSLASRGHAAESDAMPVAAGASGALVGLSGRDRPAAGRAVFFAVRRVSARVVQQPNQQVGHAPDDGDDGGEHARDDHGPPWEFSKRVHGGILTDPIAAAFDQAQKPAARARAC